MSNCVRYVSEELQESVDEKYRAEQKEINKSEGNMWVLGCLTVVELFEMIVISRPSMVKIKDFCVAFLWIFSSTCIYRYRISRVTYEIQ